MRLLPLLIVAATSTLADGSLAQTDFIVPVSQWRYAEASVNDCYYYSVDTTESATDFGPFQASVYDDATGTYGGAGGSDGDASQSSNITGDAIVVSSVVNGFAEAFCIGDEGVCAGGDSYALVEFDLTRKAAYRLSGNYSTVAGMEGFQLLRLEDGTGNVIFDASGVVTAPGDTVDVSGVLPAGRYELLVRAAATPCVSENEVRTETLTSSYALEFSEASSNYCVAAPNSVSASGATMGFTGTQDIAANDFTLQASGTLPGGSGLFFYGPVQVANQTFGDGFRCVGGSTVKRLQPPISANAQGIAERLVDFTVPPAGGGGNGTIVPGSTWNFQLWYRDAMGPGGNGFNASDGLSVTFCP